MDLQLSAAVRNGMLDAFESTIGTAAVVRLFSGPHPGGNGAPDSGTLIAEYTLASDWMAAAASGSKAFSSLPLSTTALAAGIIGHFRLYASGGTVCHAQGDVVEAGGSPNGAFEVDNVDVNLGQTVNITGWTISMPGHG